VTVISAEGYMIFLATLIAWITIQQNDNPTQAVNPTAKSVIEKFIAAKGGDSALRKIKDCTTFQFTAFLMELPVATEPMASLLGGLTFTATLVF